MYATANAEILTTSPKAILVSNASTTLYPNCFNFSFVTYPFVVFSLLTSQVIM